MTVLDHLTRDERIRHLWDHMSWEGQARAWRSLDDDARVDAIRAMFDAEELLEGDAP